MSCDFSSFAKLLCENGIKFSENEPLSSHCTFNIGGNARYFVSPANADELLLVINGANCAGVRYVIAGKGSNVIYPDGGIDGAVISTTGMCSYIIDGSTVTADAGVSLTELALRVGRAGLTGLEFAYGIPGTVGGAVFMNAGAYDGEISFVLSETLALDTSKGTMVTFRGDEHSFGYRDSVFRKNPHLVILRATFHLQCGDRCLIEEKMQGFMSSRREKQPLEYPSAGSSFKRYPGYFTAKLIDECGLKGSTVGGASVSEKHAGFIINKGGATAADVRALSDLIIETIREKHGFTIEREMIFIE